MPDAKASQNSSETGQRPDERVLTRPTKSGAFCGSPGKHLKVALVGRPNVGKSTLFNRFVGQHIAITAAEAGTTRDRVTRLITLPRLTFWLTDVGGIEVGTAKPLDADIQAQVRHAVHEADCVIFLVDATAELTADDFAAAELLRRSGKPLIFVANKWETGRETDLLRLGELGLGLPLGISAAHLTHFDELKNTLGKQLRRLRRATEEATVAAVDDAVDASIALVGRPNVGKSSLLNALLGQERVIVSEIPCTTRDTNDLLLEKGDRKYRLLDTAGLRRSGKIGTGIDRFATGRTLNALQAADVAILVIDGSEGITAQDQHVAEQILEAGTGLILAVNKCDTWQLETEDGQERWLAALADKFAFARWAPAIFISAKTGKNLEHLLPQVLEVKKARETRVPTHSLNLFFRRVISEHTPGARSGTTPLRIYYVTQAGVAPPTFVVFVNRTRGFHFSYRRYLENRLREEFGFGGTPIKIQLREKPRDEAREKAHRAKTAPKKSAKAPRGKKR